MRPLVLDTDIGTDVDDLLALLLILTEPGIRLLGVTTVHGDTKLRAAMARAVLQQSGCATVPVIAGESATLSGTPIDWKGHEGQWFGELPAYESPGIPAAGFIRSVAQRAAGELEVLAIAPLTNLAVALREDAGLAPLIKHLYIMGGAFWPPHPEHNFATDPQATREVLAAPIPTTIIGLDVTLTMILSRSDVMRLTAASTSLARIVRDQSDRWLAFLNRDFYHLHDPLAALAITRPDLFRFEHGTATLDQSLRSRLLPRTDAGTRVAAAVEVHTAREVILGRLGRVLSSES
ncbi:MAG: nucleoside hydrolase [Verrucomicrobia bacterium]|nr:nucleoside hydrolase [Verrucomicrobiota bacterium]